MLPNNRNAMLLGSNNDKICLTDIVFLRYISEGIVQSGMLTIKFEYSSSLSSINYLKVELFNFGAPSLVLFCIAGVLSLKEK